jgi:hypothetical protein
MFMHPHYKDPHFRVRTVSRSIASIFSSRFISATPRSEQRQERPNDESPSGEVSGLTKTEAEDLLDCLEAAGYESCQLSYVKGEGFTVRWPARIKRATDGKAGAPEPHPE